MFSVYMVVHVPTRVHIAALRAYAAMTTSASHGAVRDVSQVEGK